MIETEPKRTFTGRRYEINLWEDEEEITVRIKSDGAGITGMIGPLAKNEYPELFSESIAKAKVDSAARRVIQEIIHQYTPLGLEVSWSDSFPIQRFYPYKEFKNTASIFAELLRSYLKPSGPDCTLQPGDITAAIQSCLRDLIDPNITVNFKLEPYRLFGNLGSIWKSGENTFDVVVREVEGEPFEKFDIEGHEAGHLIDRFFIRDQDNSS
jgi:hypothetical protein